MSKRDDSGGGAILALVFIFFLLPPFITAYHIFRVFLQKKINADTMAWCVGNMVMTLLCLVILFWSPKLQFVEHWYLFLLYSGLLAAQIKLVLGIKKLEKEYWLY